MKTFDELVGIFTKDSREVEVYLCWTGDHPEDDDDAFFDFYEDGVCINLGEPWFAGDSLDLPSEEDFWECFGGNK